MRMYVLLTALPITACSPVTEGTGEVEGISATGTASGSDAGMPSSTSGTSSDAEPDIPTTSGGDTGGGETGAGSTGSTGQSPVCGDGVIEGGEICDDGFESNQPGNACTMSCLPASCGDGFIQPSNDETCDDGAFNVEMPGYGQCSTTCVRTAWCGDGVVQSEAGEECEPGAVDEDGCGAMCSYQSRFVFILDSTHAGDLGGLAGADKRCNQAAAGQPGLTGTYRAWLMVDGQTLADRFPEFVTPAKWKFTNTSAEMLAMSFAELVAKGPAQPIAFTEGSDAMPETIVWTGITKDGLAAGGDCAQWTSKNGAPGLVGFSGYVPNVGPEALQWKLQRKWTDLGFKRFCTELHSFYCVQVAD